jgi:Family of unknown function (DUF6311)
VLDPGNIAWIMAEHGPGANDWGQHALGWHAYRHDIWRWPFNEQKLLAYPTGLSVIYTDSNPLFALPLKPFAAWLPETFQYIGIWFLFCIVLHVVFAWKLVKPYAPNRLALLAGVICLSILPTLYYRMRHDTLMAHWLILWGLHLYFNIKDERQKTIGYATLLGFCGLIHPYILFMVFAIWAGDFLRVAGPYVRPLNREKLLPILRDSGLVLLSPIVTLGISGAYSGQSAGALGYSAYSMGLDALINPVRPEFSFFIKAIPQDPGQAFEGFQYLGFGLIVLIAMAAVLYFGFKQGKAESIPLRPEGAALQQDAFARLKHLKWPFLVLFLVTISNRIQLYDMTLLKIWLPNEVMNLMAIFRASGRMFWPISYCLILFSVIVLYQTRLRTMAWLFAAVITLQAIDLQDFAPALRAQTKEATLKTAFHRTRSPQWDAVVKAASQVDIYPPRPQMDEPLFYEIAWRAVRDRIPVSTMYASRPNPTQIALEYENRRAFLSGQLDPDHLSVFLTRCDAPEPLRGRLKSLDGILFIPPQKAAHLKFDTPQVQRAYATDELHFGWRDAGTCQLGPDWAMADQDGGSWSDGDEAKLNLPLKDISPSKPYYLNMWLISYHRARKVRLYANDKLIGEKLVQRKLTHYAFDIPQSLLRDKALRLRFDIEDPISPRKAKRGHEPYEYGVKLYMLKLANIKAEVRPEEREDWKPGR